MGRRAHAAERIGIAIGLVVFCAGLAGCSGGGGAGQPQEPGPVACIDRPGEVPFDGMRRIRVGLEKREYILHVPSSTDPNRAVPLVLMFHGLNGKAEEMPAFTGLNDLADTKGFIVAYPQGDKGPEGNTGWLASGGSRDFNFVAKVIKELSGEYCVDSHRTFSVGHSNGAFFTYRLACDRTNLFAAFAAFAGGPAPLRCSPAHPIPIALFQGTDDKVVDPVLTEKAKDAFVALDDCRSSVVLPDGCVRYTECAEGSEVLWCLVPGMSHLSWPGGANDPGGPVDGNAELWGFFEAHPAP